MSDKRRLIDRIDIGDDCVLVYRIGDSTSLVVTSRDNGDIELFLDSDQCVRVIKALTSAESE